MDDSAHLTIIPWIVQRVVIKKSSRNVIYHKKSSSYRDQFEFDMQSFLKSYILTFL